MWCRQLFVIVTQHLCATGDADIATRAGAPVRKTPKESLARPAALVASLLFVAGGAPLQGGIT